VIAWPVILRFSPWALAILGVSVGLLGVRGCAAGLEHRGELKAKLEQAGAELAAERECRQRTSCAERALTDAAAAQAAVNAETERIRADNERRVADAVARYVRTAERERAASTEWRRKYESQKAIDPSCAAWASERVGCIMRPISPAEVDQGAGDREAAGDPSPAEPDPVVFADTPDAGHQ
jgi:hypothetical protein